MSYYTPHPIDNYCLYYTNLDKPRAMLANRCQEAWDLFFACIADTTEFLVEKPYKPSYADNLRWYICGKVLYNCYVSLSVCFDGVSVEHQIKNLAIEDFLTWLMSKDYAQLPIFGSYYYGLTQGEDIAISPEGAAAQSKLESCVSRVQEVLAAYGKHPTKK